MTEMHAPMIPAIPVQGNADILRSAVMIPIHALTMPAISLGAASIRQILQNAMMAMPVR
jgi:hypothetical protein